MKLVIDMPDRKPTPGDHEAILTAVDSLRIGMGLRRPPKWTIEPSHAEPLTTTAIAAEFGRSDRWVFYAFKGLGIEPIDTKTKPRRWHAADVIKLREWHKANGRQRKAKGGTS